MEQQIFFIRRPLYLACSQGSIFSMKSFDKKFSEALTKNFSRIGNIHFVLTLFGLKDLLWHTFVSSLINTINAFNTVNCKTFGLFCVQILCYVFVLFYKKRHSVARFFSSLTMETKPEWLFRRFFKTLWCSYSVACLARTFFSAQFD
jgi:hypothetical protein